ncbi:MAG: transcription-repair coupling factor [Bacteroidia bacterium]|nr:transcription-repair coupling factor [Bacteroidia bacterium]
MNKLIQTYLASNWLKNLPNYITQTQFIHLSGISGGLLPVSIATAFYRNVSNILYIAQDKEEALYAYNDLNNLGIPTLFMPSAYKRPFQYQTENVENTQLLQRIQVLNHIVEQKPFVIVTYPEAIAEKVIKKEYLQKNKIYVQTGNTLDIQFIVELLQEYAFEQVDIVYEAGQFAVRGGIIDVFSYAAPYPYRIELWGDTVQSIRTFDPETQLSIQNVDTITLLPDIQTHYQENSHISLMEFLPNKTVAFVKNLDFVTQMISKCFETAVKTFFDAQQDKTISIHYVPEQAFIHSEEFIKHLTQWHTVIECGNKPYFNPTQVLHVESQGLPTFMRNFDNFIKHIQQYEKANYKTFICAENEKQIQRIQEIFEDKDLNIAFTPLQIGLSAGFIDHTYKVVCYTDHQIFEKYYRYKEPKFFKKSEALTIQEFKDLKPGDYVVHIDYGIAKFGGLETLELAGKKQECMKLFYEGGDVLYVSVHSLHKVSKYAGKEGSVPRLHKLGSATWRKAKEKTKKRVKELAFDLLTLYAKRKLQQGFACAPDNYLNYELEANFMYEDTPDQIKAWEEIKKDMESPRPMDRLLCGDVGCGKTELAIRAAFKAVVNGKQVAVLVPTTVLATQHYHTFQERLQNFGVNIRVLSRFRSQKEIKETLSMLKEGKVDIVIGTHRLVSKDVEFKDLGLLIIDEEQKFGVGVKEKLRTIKENVDTLTLTATPIPRTLYFSLMGARDLSTIKTMPPNRQPVHTEVLNFNEQVIKNAIEYELSRNGQVYFVHNRVEDIYSIASLVQNLVPHARILVGHGQMQSEKLEEVMTKFVEHQADVLVCTTIIESGLDIPNANTIIIHNAHLFGLSDLHQMRGRVGRSNKKAFCYLLVPSLASLPTEQRKRLELLEEYSDLGAGFSIALKDLEIRGSGDLLGADQSGFINEMGFETYQQILNEAIQELKKEQFSHIFPEEKDISPVDCVIETDEELRIPDTYVSNIALRMNLYTELSKIDNEADLNSFKNQLQDRFGPLPGMVQSLVESMKLKWLGKSLGLEKISFKNHVVKCYFIPDKNAPFFKSEAFGKLLEYVAKNGKTHSLKQIKEQLILGIQPIADIPEVVKSIEKLVSFIQLDKNEVPMKS